MKWLGTKKVRLSHLILPGDFPHRLKSASVAARAKSIKEVGLIALPVVEWPTKRLIAGGDRCAALKLLGEESIEVRAVEGSAVELRRVMLAENIERRTGERDELVAEYVGAAEKDILTQQAITPPTGGLIADRVNRGRPTTPRGEARRLVADTLGITPKAVERAEEKAAAAKRPAPPAPPRVLFEDWGISLDRELELALTAVCEHIDAADQQLRAVQSHLGQAFEACPDEWSDLRDEVDRFRTEAKRLAQDLRAQRPKAVCPYCKAFAPVRLTCAACDGSGEVRGEDMVSMPEELRLRGDEALVMVDGRHKRLADLLGSLNGHPA